MNEFPPAGSELSRRSLVRTAATAAAGGALVLAGPALSAQAADRAGRRPAVRAQPLPADRTGQPPAARVDAQHQAGDGVMVRVIDVRTGTLELYTADGHRTVVDRALAQ